MLKHLHIENIALISRLDIEFSEGLTVLSGETGSGKSIIIDALAFVLGERADKTLIKFGENQAFVEVAFEVLPSDIVYSRLEQLGFEQDTTIVISRTLTLAGKNESRLNGRICPSSVLRQISAALVDIFGQSEHLNLLKTDNHIKILDEYSRRPELRAALSESYAELRMLRRSLSAFGGSDAERERLLDILSFQINEIEAAHLSEEEESELLLRRSRALNMEKIASALSSAVGALSGTGSHNALSCLNIADSALIPACSFDTEVEQLSARLSGARIEIEDISGSLSVILSACEYNPREMDKLEERLDKIKSIKKKYGGSIPNALAFLADAQLKIVNLSNAAEEIAEINRKIEKLTAKMFIEAKELSACRMAAAKSLQREIETQLADLGMNGTRFETRFTPPPQTVDEFAADITANGYDKPEFLLSPNKGEELKPLTKIISGGEMSRFMLAIKNITAEIENIPTMVFDEIDIGISGTMAQMVAKKLANVAGNYQCIVITHLPQITAMADTNVLIHKREEGGKTLTHLTILDKNGKIEEISRLLSGPNIGSYGVLHAQELIAWANDYKRQIEKS